MWWFACQSLDVGYTSLRNYLRQYIELLVYLKDVSCFYLMSTSWCQDEELWSGSTLIQDDPFPWLQIHTLYSPLYGFISIPGVQDVGKMNISAFEKRPAFLPAVKLAGLVEAYSSFLIFWEMKPDNHGCMD